MVKEPSGKEPESLAISRISFIAENGNLDRFGDSGDASQYGGVVVSSCLFYIAQIKMVI